MATNREKQPLTQSIEKFDTLRGFLKDSDRFKVSLLEEHGTFPYELLSYLLSKTGKPQVSLYVEELRRNPTGVVRFSEKKVSRDKNEKTGLVPDLDEFLRESFSNPVKDTIGTNLHLCYMIIIAPVVHLLEEPEIIIVPDPSMYQVPFAALIDQEGKWLSETKRIRIVPSLTTLKLIQDSPSDYHNQTGALIVGDPVVGVVLYKDRRKEITPLPKAKKEADMIAELLGVTALIGNHATKQAVLEAMNSVSLIHFAAHGSDERGEIFLSPERTNSRVPPREEAYLLTMEDISKIQLRAKLVVLSCCHSARGQIRTEGVIGIARAFLGSGARSVLAARWALEDEATEQFMTCFYKHL
ncbi:Tetratricopeptide repeat protein 28 [Stylophora pistillata]|uniref:Tetratricopeptide repeat protein 28 n=1 Tax=Stylophora pistillata TaxID=50429 RepID=A0A2B4T131_STYPI|nr:Tetratricopeptide repeat protein 28 [Stylophora pistillata]